MLVTGGLYTGGPDGEAISTTGCALFDGSAWVVQAPLPVSVAWHDQFTLASGKTFVAGGMRSAAREPTAR